MNNPKLTGDDEIFTPEEAAKMLRMADLGFPDPVKAIKAWARKGIIECAHIGKKVVFTRAHLRAYLNRGTQIENRPRRRRRPQT